MRKRTVLAAVLATIGMFAWSSIAHMATPLGDAGIREIPNEDSVLKSLRTALGDSHGLYMYPGLGAEKNSTAESRGALMERYAAKLAGNPSGLLVYHPPGAKPMMPSQLVTEFLSEFAECLIAIFLLSWAGIRRFGSRVAFVTLVGLAAGIMTNVQYWNWYGFPLEYTIPYMTIEIVGFIVAGCVAAAVLRERTNKSLTAGA